MFMNDNKTSAIIIDDIDILYDISLNTILRLQILLNYQKKRKIIIR